MCSNYILRVYWYLSSVCSLGQRFLQFGICIVQSQLQSFCCIALKAPPMLKWYESVMGIKTPVALLHTTTKLVFTVDGYFDSWRFHKTIVKVIVTVSTSISLFDRTCLLAQQDTAYSILDYKIVQYITSFPLCYFQSNCSVC